MKITNTQPGPRGVNTINGPVLVEAGATLEDVQVYAREQQHIEATGWFKVEGEYTTDPAERQASTGDNTAELDDLKQQLADKDKEIADLKKLVPEADVDKMTVPELRAQLALKGVKFGDEKKDELVALVKEAHKPAS